MSGQNERKDLIIVGAALFAMFFGAGNLIFPSALGFHAGDNWIWCTVGFFITGVGLPIAGIIAVAKTEGSFDKFAGKVSPLFAKILGIILILSIGPFLAIPRTGATVYEIGIKPLFSGVNPFLVSVIYFSAALFFVLKPSSIIDKTGKYLTPVLLLIISSIIIKGVVSPMGVPVDTGSVNPFSKGFIEGYQTMDALASIVLGGLVLISLRAKGYTEPKDQIRLASLAGFLAGAALLLVYGGLLYLGATGSSLFNTDITKADLITSITNNLFGIFGQTAMCIVVSVACLTTTIGLIAVVGNFFEELTGGKLSYTSVVIMTTVFSAVVSVSGIEKIVMFSVPLLVVAYPIVIVLIVLTIVGEKFHANVFRGAVTGASCVSIFDALSFFKMDTGMAGEFDFEITICKIRFFLDNSLTGLCSVHGSSHAKNREPAAL